ncbi:MAG: M20/M25/M40 family metallo-hydrolase [Chitinophagales bacterium]|nr:M20/M25/M40 family metallo-hydrolase [Chitinophagales bacterium]
MKALISDVIDRFGPRAAGSEAEKASQLYVKQLMEGFCDKVLFQPFAIAPHAKFESLKLFYGLYWVCLALFFVDIRIALTLSLVNFILFLGHFLLYYHWLDFLYKKGTSHNTIGTVEPSGEVKRTIIFSGHMDSAREFFWWYHLKDLGIVLTIISGFLLVLLPIYYLLCLIFGNDTAWNLGWWFFLATSPVTLSMFFIHNKAYVPGAQDNLSGVTLAMELGRFFANPENRLKHIRIKVASFGSEEIGLQGAHAYVKQFHQELLAENAININLDGIKDRDQLHILNQEIMLLVKYPADLVQRMHRTFNELQVPHKVKPLGFGATDAAAFARQGIPALAIIGISMKKLDPTYHTRLDLPDCVDEHALEDVKKVLVRFTQQLDGE